MSSTRDLPKPVTYMFTRNIPQNSEYNILLATLIVFPRHYKVDVFLPQSPYLEIALQFLNNFLTIYFQGNSSLYNFV